MFCPNCGTNLANDAAFCPNCGNRLNTNYSPVVPVNEKPKKVKKKTGKVIAAFISLLVVIAIVVTVVIVKPFGDKNGTNLISDKKENLWYVAERTTNYTLDFESEYKSHYEYLDKVQILESSFDDETTTYTYDKKNRLTAIDSSDYSIYFDYEEKGSKFVGTSSTYYDNGESYYMIVKYNQNNQLVLQETYCNEHIESSFKYTYHPNGEVNECIYTNNFFDYYVQTFDEKGNEILIEWYDTDGKSTKKKVYEYDGNRLIGSKYFAEDGELIENEVLDNIVDNKVKTTTYNYNNEIIEYSEYFYDENDHLIKAKVYNDENDLIQDSVNIWKVMK